MNIIKIKKGKHYSGFTLPQFSIYDGKAIRRHYRFMFNESALYNIDYYGNHINKLCGISFGYHHNNSIRIGWKPNGEGISLYSYVYKDGQRYEDKLKDIDINEIVDLKIYVTDVDSLIVIDDSQLFNSDFNIKGKKICYELRPYFGGTPTAPHDINIYLTNGRK